MVRQHISESLKVFIREQIQTVFRLEVLLLLHRNQSRSFTTAEITSELGVSTDVAQEQLTALEASGLLGQSNTEETAYRYHPADAALRSMVDQLAVSYSRQRVPILSLMLAKRPDRIRLFAEAFKLIQGHD